MVEYGALIIMEVFGCLIRHWSQRSNVLKISFTGFNLKFTEVFFYILYNGCKTYLCDKGHGLICLD